MKTITILVALLLANSLAAADTLNSTLESRLNSQIPSEYKGINIPGRTKGGSGCEIAISRENGKVSVSILEQGMFGLGYFDLSYNSKPVTGVEGNAQQITVKMQSPQTQAPEEAVFVFKADGRLQSAELREESKNLFGFKSMKSAIKCNLP